MAKFAPTYMREYDGPEYSLETLVLSADTFVVDSPEDTVIGTLTGVTDEFSSLSIVETDGFVKLDGEDLVVGPNAAEVGTFTVTVRETNPYGDNSPNDTEFEITVTAE